MLSVLASQLLVNLCSKSGTGQVWPVAKFCPVLYLHTHTHTYFLINKVILEYSCNYPFVFMLSKAAFMLQCQNQQMWKWGCNSVLRMLA